VDRSRNGPDGPAAGEALCRSTGTIPHEHRIPLFSTVDPGRGGVTLDRGCSGWVCAAGDGRGLCPGVHLFSRWTRCPTRCRV
jgi:hypothetical protein